LAATRAIAANDGAAAAAPAAMVWSATPAARSAVFSYGVIANRRH